MAKFYVDTCIYINLWQKEVESGTGVELWKRARVFFDKHTHQVFYYSGYILKELSYRVSREEYLKKTEFFEKTLNYSRVGLSKEEFLRARLLEKQLNFEISFFDVLHLVISKKYGAILVTRDKKLLEIAKKYSVEAKRPEEL